MNGDYSRGEYQQDQHRQQAYPDPAQPGYPAAPPPGGYQGGWQQMPPQQPVPPKKKHRGLKIIGGTVGALILLGIIVNAADGSGSAPTTATQPAGASQPGQAAAQPSPAAKSGKASAAKTADAACQLLPTIESQVKAGNYDVAQRDAEHSESLASKESSLSSFDEVADFGTLAMDLLNDGGGIDKGTVNADLATVTDDCK